MSVLKRLVLAVVAMLLLGVASGFVWIQLAHPANWEVRTDGSIVLTEVAAADKFSVIMVFMAIGAVVSLVWALLASFALKDLGWFLTPLVILATAAAAVIAWRIGVTLGPDGPLAAVKPAVGTKIPSKLAVDGVAPFLIWPIAGLLGVVCATWLSHEAPSDEPIPAAL